MFVEHKEQGEVTEAPAKLDEASKLLLKAAAVLEKRGHCKNALVEGDPMSGPVCVYGALNAAANEGHAYFGVCGELVYRAAGRVGDAVGGPPDTWNNLPERTAEEVISTMRRVALGL